MKGEWCVRNPNVFCEEDSGCSNCDVPWLACRYCGHVGIAGDQVTPINGQADGICNNLDACNRRLVEIQKKKDKEDANVLRR